MPKNLDEFKTRHDPQTIIARLENELKAATQVSATAVAIREILGTAAERLDEYDPPAWTIKPHKDGAQPGVPTLFLSDLHWGEVVRASEVNWVNAYSVAHARERLRYTIETAIHLCKLLSPKMEYPGIVLMLGGDMVSGEIHEELQATNELATIPTLFDLFERMCGAIKTLAEAFGHVFITAVSGNHGRNTRKTWAKQRNHTSYDWLLYQFLARHFKGDARVTFFIPDGSDALFRVYGTRYLLTHGDQFKAGDSIIGPIGPLMRGNQKKTARNQAVNQEYDVLCVGHWHQYIHLARLVVNGSLKGYDEYAYQGNFGFEPPMQALWITHPRYGITYRMPVYCEQPKRKPVSAWVSVSA